MNCDSERMNYSIKLFWITSACIDHLTAEYYGKKKMVKYTCMVQYMNLIWFNKKSFCNYKKLRNTFDCLKTYYVKLVQGPTFIE